MKRIMLLAVAIAMSLSLLVAAPAEAHRRRSKPVRRATPARVMPSLATWERLAQCESGGRWQLRGRRYSGGLQFDVETWQGVGGTGAAWQHSKAEQIKRATILHSRRGFKPWPGCSRKLGLR